MGGAAVLLAYCCALRAYSLWTVYVIPHYMSTGCTRVARVRKLNAQQYRAKSSSVFFVADAFGIHRCL